MLTWIRAQLPLLRRSVRRRRRTLAVLVAALLVAALAPALLPPTVRGTSVVVTAVDLPAGTELSEHQLREVRIAAELVPTGAPTSQEDVVGRETALPLPAGAPVLPGVLTGGGPTELPEGFVLMAVPVPSALVPRLTPGVEIEILSTGPDLSSPERITARVVELPAAQPTGSSLVAPGAGASTEMVVAVERTRSGDLAHSLHEGWMSISLIG
ncbi:SAF domain-containing protein [Brachybacterium tyrofermentans]|uniref:SAF domain-containing protein n=1 Tax=Brachybacterium tyrofermentans TaxID=47848 RepID=UPI001867AC17|nr:SAF domain-containing protein [Brachybacterium tyrofermentans]